MTMMRSTTVSSSSSSSSSSSISFSSSSSVFRNLALTIICLFLSLDGDHNNVGFVLGQSQPQDSNSYHNQVQQRVREKIRNFMSGPSIALQYWSDYYSLGGFDNDLNGSDRDKVATYLYSMSLSSEYWMPFYGLENGVFLGYFHNRYNIVPRLIYREPGDSGYNLMNTSDDDVDMSILYKDTCVNKESGEAEECTMVEDGGSYVSCINDCELVKCSINNNNDDDDNPESDLFQKEEDCSIHMEGSTEKQDCESRIVWCKNYSIETTANTQQQQQQQRLGYVPRTEYCMDSQGLFSQTPNEILLETESGGIELGDCTYGNGITTVQRNIMGPYASCGEVHDSNLGCDTTYVGGHTSSDYDPRWRGWYLSSKAAQRPRWSDPYIFFSLKVLGITYTHPIYSKTDQDETGEIQGRKLFAGVLAADMLLDDISNFLVSAFQNTTFFVAIYEASEPYNMIGISTGSEIVKRVLVDDKSRPCPPTNDDGNDDDSEECTLVQITIDDLNGSIENEILRKSHTALAENGFDNSRGDSDDDIIAVKEDDDITHSTAYVPTIAKFDQREANLEWHILVTTPVERDSADTILKGETLFVVICVIASLGCAICLFLGTLFYCKRNERAIRLADFRFTCAFIWWVAFLNLSSLTLLGEITDDQCMLRMWTQNMIASLALSPLFVKAFRTWRLLGTVTSSAGRAQMNNFQAWIRTLPIPIAQATILTIFTILDPPVATESITLEGETPIQSIYCGHNSSAFDITQATFYAILIITGCILAYLTRNIDTRFADSKELLFAMYNIAFSILMVGTISTLLPLPGEALNVLVTTAVFWISVFSSVVFVVPRLMAVYSDRQKLESRMSQMRLQSARSRAGGFASSRKVSFQGDSLHDDEDALKILVCSANVGNAEPTMASMKGWIPEGGKCDKVTTLNGRPIKAERFDLIVIGMQESTWSNKGNKKNTGHAANISTGSIRTIESITVRTFDSVKTPGDGSEATQNVEDQDDKIEAGDLCNASEVFMAAVEGEDTVALRKMEQAILGDQYSLVKEEMRGQMRLHIFALESKVPFLENIKVSGANTGIGNVLANKGGIIVSFLYQKTRFTFLSAHLAAHEGESYYQARCDNVSTILDASKTFKLSQKFDLALCSHHMFVFGDLNFRTKFADKIEHEESVNKALELIEKEDFEELYSFDELHKGVKNGDLLLDFETLPCQFHPTFKVERQPGFIYKKQRTPSYTDRILFKTSPGLEGLVKPLAYEPCVDFVTSDHKPIRGAFSIVPNETMGTIDMKCRFRMVFSEMECSNLPAADMNGKSDPYLSFVWDSVDLVEEKRVGFHLPRFLQRTSSPHTSFKSRTLNPKWTNEEIILVSTSHSVSSGAVLYVSAYDYDFGAADDLLGTAPLSVGSLFSMKESQEVKTVTINRPLQANGRKVGTITFKVDITKIIG